ncbi:MAG: ribosomal small subunit methyltransferase, partial [Flaviaesturariibacter sp.]|nr:ribosomal small subunit methyltransferase [Flaviaesturariibacter sp.]
TSKHVIGVLRMKTGASLRLTDGRGRSAVAIITDDHRKRCTVRLTARSSEPPPTKDVAIAISLVKNASRFEWFLEKSTELGVSEIIPLRCARTESEKFRPDRLQSILVSAMLQSQQSRLPRLHEPIPFDEALRHHADHRFIAHCAEGVKNDLAPALQPAGKRLILVGPEGDFTQGEIDAALGAGFSPVALGATRLRTETAGIVAATLLTQL